MFQYTGFLTLYGQIQLLFFRQATNLEMSTLPVPNQVSRHVLEYRVQWLELRVSHELLVRITTGQEVPAENLVLTVRYSRDGEHQPGLIWEVLLHKIDTGRYLESIEISQQLLDQHLFARGSHADPEHYLRLVHREDLALLDQQQLLFGHVLAVFIGKELTTSG